VFLSALLGCSQEPALVEQLPPTEVTHAEMATATIMPTQTVEYSTVNEEQQLKNLIAFSRLYGYIRYFHPSDQVAAENNDWVCIAMGGIAVVRDAQNSADLAERLQNYFQPLAPTVQVFVAEGGIPPLPDELSLPPGAIGVQVVMWEHYGVADEFAGKFRGRSPYSSHRLFKDVTDGKIPDGFHDPREPYYADLGGGIAAQIPLGLFVDSEKNNSTS